MGDPCEISDLTSTRCLLTRLVAVCLLLGVSVQPPRVLLTVPHQQLRPGLQGPDGVEEHVTSVLTGHQVLLGRGTHPAAALHVISVSDVVKLPAGVNLTDDSEIKGLQRDSVKKHNLVNATVFRC